MSELDHVARLEDLIEATAARDALVPGQSVFFGRVFFRVLGAMAMKRCGHPDLIIKGAWELAEQAERRPADPSAKPRASPKPRASR